MSGMGLGRDGNQAPQTLAQALATALAGAPPFSAAWALGRLLGLSFLLSLGWNGFVRNSFG